MSLFDEFLLEDLAEKELLKLINCPVPQAMTDMFFANARESHGSVAAYLDHLRSLPKQEINTGLYSLSDKVLIGDDQ